MQLSNKKKKYLYLYILGDDNKWNRVSTPVPYRIYEKESFFGPCKKPIRENIKKNFLKDYEKVDLRDKNCPYEIYIAGINPAKKDEIRELLFAGKIEELFTFKYAWIYYHERAKKEKKIKEMINGIEGKRKKDLGKKFSPLHLKPKEEGGRIGYEHVTDEHEDWIHDLLSDKEISTYKRILNIGHLKKKDFLEYIKKQSDENKKKKIFKYEKEKIIFQRDCCFSVKNCFFSHRDNNYTTIKLNKDFLKIIIDGFKKNKKIDRIETHTGPDVKAPFGYARNPKKPSEFYKYGRGYLLLEDKLAESFINHIEQKLIEISSYL